MGGRANFGAPGVCARGNSRHAGGRSRSQDSKSRDLAQLSFPHGSDCVEESRGKNASGLAHHQHFSDVIAGEKEFNGSEIAEEILDVAVVEHALQLETIR